MGVLRLRFGSRGITSRGFTEGARRLCISHQIKTGTFQRIRFGQKVFRSQQKAFPRIRTECHQGKGYRLFGGNPKLSAGERRIHKKSNTRAVPSTPTLLSSSTDWVNLWQIFSNIPVGLEEAPTLCSWALL